MIFVWDKILTKLCCWLKISYIKTPFMWSQSYVTCSLLEKTVFSLSKKHLSLHSSSLVLSAKLGLDTASKNLFHSIYCLKFDMSAIFVNQRPVWLVARDGVMYYRLVSHLVLGFTYQQINFPWDYFAV